MTVSSDARTPSASVHALSGSTPPGSAPVVQPFGVATAPAGVAEMPETFAPLGPIATGIAGRLRPGHTDAAVIDLAERVKALADRHARVYHRMLVIHGRVDRWHFANRPKRPDTMPSGLTLARSRTDTHEVTHIEQPLSLLSEQKAQREAYEAAAAAHEEAVERKRARTREPYLDKLQARMWWRLECWVRALVDAEPQTQAGLAAKAAASVAVTRAADDLDWARDLATSISADALRIICAEAEARAEQDRQADGELLALAPAWEASCLRFKSSDEVHDAASDRYQHPEFPHGLLCRDTDRTGLGPYPRQDVRTGAWIFGDWNTIATLRANLASGHGSARHAEIVQAFDEWRAAEAAEEERSGLAAARAENEAAIEENQRLIRRICVTPAHTTTGIDFKMRAALWSLGGIDGLAEDLRPGEVEHPGSGITMALSFLLDVARQRSGAQGKPEREDLAA